MDDPLPNILEQSDSFINNVLLFGDTMELHGGTFIHHGIVQFA